MHETFHYHLFIPIWIVDLRGLGSVYRKIFWARPISNFSISRPKGREIEIGDQSLAQKIFRYTDPFPLRSIQSTIFEIIGLPQCKVNQKSIYMSRTKFWAKSTFGWLCFTMLHKSGHAKYRLGIDLRSHYEN